MITEFRSNQLRHLAKSTVGVGAKLERVCSTPNEKTGIARNQLRQLRELCCIRKNYDYRWYKEAYFCMLNATQ